MMLMTLISIDISELTPFTNTPLSETQRQLRFFSEFKLPSEYPKRRYESGPVCFVRNGGFYFFD